MSRLTEKLDDGHLMTAHHKEGHYRPAGFHTSIQCYEKLGKLEDIEDELGLDLLTLFKALCGMYAVKEDDGRITEEWSCPRFQAPAILGHGFNAWIVIRDDERRKILYLKDYGKTWALTKEELQ